MKLEAATRLAAAIPLSLYRTSMRGVALLNPDLYTAVFNKYGSGNNPKNKYRIYIPLNVGKPVQDTTKTPNAEVLEYLADNGFTLDNYALGTAIMPDGKRTIKIGKVLAREPELKKLFDNDPVRKAVRSVEGKMMVVISRHPYDVLGISFDRGWTSCTNLQDGENAGKLKSSIKFGLLAAYLVKADDKNINRPSARILIRPYFNTKGDALLVMDANEYGSAPGSFRATVKKFVDVANSGSPKGNYAAPKGMYLDAMPKQLKHKLTADDVRTSDDVQWVTDPDELMRLVKTFPEEVMKNPNATPEILMIGAKDKRQYVRFAVARSPNATPEILMIGAKDEDRNVRFVAMYNRNATPEILMIGAKDKELSVRSAVMSNRNATTEILMIGAKDAEFSVRSSAMYNRNATPEILMIGAKDKDARVRVEVMKNPNATPEILMVGAKDEDRNVRSSAMYNRNATPEILMIGAKDKDEDVRFVALRNPNATPEIS